MKVGDLVMDTTDDCIMVYLGKVCTGGQVKYQHIFVDVETCTKWEYDWHSVRHHIEAVDASW